MGSPINLRLTVIAKRFVNRSETNVSGYPFVEFSEGNGQIEISSPLQTQINLPIIAKINGVDSGKKNYDLDINGCSAKLIKSESFIELTIQPKEIGDPVVYLKFESE